MASIYFSKADLASSNAAVGNGGILRQCATLGLYLLRGFHLPWRGIGSCFFANLQKYIHEELNMSASF